MAPLRPASCPHQVVLGTDMKQHFSTVHDFTEKLAASGLIGTTTAIGGLTTSRAPPDDHGVALAPGSLPSPMVQQQPVVGSSRRGLPGRTNSMLDLKDALHTAAAAGPIRTVTAGK